MRFLWDFETESDGHPSFLGVAITSVGIFLLRLGIF